jgi:phage terminase small subunit
MKKLSPFRQRFVEEYLIDLNGTAAYKRAGGAKKAASAAASRLLRNVNIQAIVRKLMRKRGARLEITADRVLQEIATLAFFKPEYAYNTLEGGQLEMKTFKEMGRWSGAVSEIREDRIIKEVKGTADKPDAEMVLSDKRTLKFHDKTTNLRTLSEHLGILKNQVPVFPENVTYRFVYEDPKNKGKDKE